MATEAKAWLPSILNGSLLLSWAENLVFRIRQKCRRKVVCLLLLFLKKKRQPKSVTRTWR